MRYIDWTIATGLCLALAACGSDGDDGDGAGGTGGGGTHPACDGVSTAGCSTVLRPGPEDTTALQTAFIEAASGDTVCLCPGNYAIDNELSVAVPNLTIKGLGATPDATVLDFAGQQGNHGIDATGNGFAVENVWVKNTTGNGIVVTGAEGVTFRKLKVTWDAGSVTENGAYAVYPVSSTNVLIEETEVIGAADAGIYVGQCEDVIVRNSNVHGNVAGIEIENTTRAYVHDNEAWDNTAGILVFVLPNLEKKDGLDALVSNNHVHANNRENFAEPGTIVASVPPGTGLLLLAADNTEITGNRIENNHSAGTLVLSYEILKLVLEGVTDDPGTDPYPEKIHIHANTFMGNGAEPQGILAALGVTPLESIVWDGLEDAAKSGAELCLGTTDLPTFRSMNGNPLDATTHTTDATPHACSLPPVPPVEL
jgi:parallel beta-helix repeat protein